MTLIGSTATHNNTYWPIGTNSTDPARIDKTIFQLTCRRTCAAICRLATTSRNNTRGTTSRVGKNSEAPATTMAEKPNPA